MEPDRTDTNLLFGILAVKMNFIRKEDLFEAMGAWFLDRHRTLGEILVERQALSGTNRNLLDAMVRESQVRQGPAARPGVPDGVPPATRPSESLLPTQAPREDPAATAGENGFAADGEMTVTWSTRRRAAGGDERYVVIRSHAKGGIGRVSVALDVALNREVALKELLDERREEAESRARFQLEAEVTARLEHPGIVPVYAIGSNDRGEPFYVMRFIKGESFKEAVRQFHQDCGRRWAPGAGESWLRFQQLLRRFIDVCDTIAYAHSRGVIHRDLKPSNVVVGKYGETLVVDWGLAKFVGRDELHHQARDEATLRPTSHSGSTDTIAGIAVGTPAFMSPEQAEGDLTQVGFASDVYGLGATLYYLLTGRNPITDQEVTTVLRHARRGEFRRPREVNSRIPPALEAICLKAMAYRPEDRYGSPRDLAQDLERRLADEPVSAWPEPLRLKMLRWVNRNRTLVSSAAAAILVAAATGGYLAYEGQMDRVRRGSRPALGWTRLSTAEVRGAAADRRPARRGSRPGPRPVACAPGSRRDGRRPACAALALLPDEPAQARFLFDRMVRPESTPEEVLVIREGLRRAGAGAVRRAGDRGPPPAGGAARRRRDATAGTAGRCAPGWDRWPEFAGRIAARLVRVNPSEIAAWRRVFQPIAAELEGPLRSIYAGAPTPALRPGILAAAGFRLAAGPPGPSRGPGRPAGRRRPGPVPGDPPRLALARGSGPGPRGHPADDPAAGAGRPQAGGGPGPARPGAVRAGASGAGLAHAGPPRGSEPADRGRPPPARVRHRPVAAVRAPAIGEEYRRSAGPDRLPGRLRNRGHPGTDARRAEGRSCSRGTARTRIPASTGRSTGSCAVDGATAVPSTPSSAACARPRSRPIGAGSSIRRAIRSPSSAGRSRSGWGRCPGRTRMLAATRRPTSGRSAGRSRSGCGR